MKTSNAQADKQTTCFRLSTERLGLQLDSGVVDLELRLDRRLSNQNLTLAHISNMLCLAALAALVSPELRLHAIN